MVARLALGPIAHRRWTDLGGQSVFRGCLFCVSVGQVGREIRLGLPAPGNNRSKPRASSRSSRTASERKSAGAPDSRRSSIPRAPWRSSIWHQSNQTAPASAFETRIATLILQARLKFVRPRKSVCLPGASQRFQRAYGTGIVQNHIHSCVFRVASLHISRW